MGGIVTTMADVFNRDQNAEAQDLMLVSRYKPEALETLLETTYFTKSEIRLMYRGFKQYCPGGVVDKSTFTAIFQQFFPLGDVSNYASHVFHTFDQDSSGTITFEEFLAGLSVMCRGSLEEKVRWVFSLYDTNKDGVLTREELLVIVSSIYDMVGTKFVYPPVGRSTASDHVDLMFEKMDADQDGIITEIEFIEYCLNSHMICSSIAMFDTAIPED